MKSAGRRSRATIQNTRTPTNGGVAHDIATAVLAAVPGSNGAEGSLRSSLSVLEHDARVHEKTRPIVAPVLNASIEGPDANVTAVIAQDALKRALRHVPPTAIAVVGSRSGILVEWLHKAGRAAQPCTLPRAEIREIRRARTTRPAVVLATDPIESQPYGGEFFAAIKRILAPDGLLIAIVPNLTHARARIAMLLGRYSVRSNGQGPSLTLADIERAWHDAAFTIIDIERQVDSADMLKELSDGVPEPVVRLLADDVDAMTTHFVVLAEPHTSASVSRCHRRLSDIADAHRVAEHATNRVEARVAELEVRVQHWAAEIDQLAVRDATRSAGERTPADERIEHEMHVVTERLAADRASDTQRDTILNRARESLLTRTAEAKALTGRIEKLRYQREVLRIRQVVRRQVPAGSTVAVVSRGDEGLVAFDDRRGWHFPRTQKGVYAGHHPADSKAAIRHLEELRSRGAQYLVIPRTAFWWLEHYREFSQHLERRCRCVWRDERTGVMFALEGRKG